MISDLYQKLKNYGVKKSFRFGFFECYRFFWLRLFKKSYSLNGEDLVIDHLLNFKQEGFYIDLGANDHDRFSNTKRFFNRGWRGINIDANPYVIDSFIKNRPEDINVNVGVGKEGGVMDFFLMFPTTVSTFSFQMKEKNIKEGCEHLDTVKVHVETLSSILKSHLPKGTDIDLMSIDLEGFDFEALKSNDWSLFRPAVICIESPTSFFDGDFKKQTRDIVNYLDGANYELVYHNGMDAFFKNSLK